MSRLMWKRRFMSGGVAMALLGLLFVSLHCSKENPSLPFENDQDSWTFTVTVQDGQSGSALSHASVTYINREGTQATAPTDAKGLLSISGLAAGSQSFTIAYTQNASVDYTSTVVSAEGKADAASGGKLLDQSAVVKLFPLQGAIAGTITTRVNNVRAATPAENVVVNVTYTNADLANATPRAFSANTDQNGVFTIAGMPVAANCAIAISSMTINGVDYSASAVTAPTLTLDDTIPLGTIVMQPINSANFQRLTAAPVVMGPVDSIVLTYAAALDSLSYAILEGQSGAASVAVTTKTSGAKLTIVPASTLVEGQQFKLTVYAYGAKGGQDVYTPTGMITIRGGLDVASSNVYNPGTGQAISGIGVNDTILFTATKTLISATAVLTRAGAGVPATTTVSGASVKIHPLDMLKPATTYTLVLTMQTAAEAKTITTSFVTASSDFFPITSNVRFDNDANKPVLDFAPNGVIAIVMSKPVSTATAALTPAIDVDVRISADTIRITPSQALAVGTSYVLDLSAKSTANLSYDANPFVNGLGVQANKVRILASNTMTADGLGLNNIATTATLWFLLSATPNAADLKVDLSSGPSVTVTLSGDTVKVKPVSNLSPAPSTYSVTMTGKTTTGNSIDITSPTFGTEKDIFWVNTNTKDDAGANAVDFAIYGEMWVKFSEALSTSVADILWASATPGTTLYGNPALSSYNATARVHGDTLFVKPDYTRVTLGYNAVVGFSVKVMSATGKVASSYVTFKVTTIPSDLYVKWTNMKDALGNARTDVGLNDTVRIVLSVGLDKINTASFAGAPLATSASVNDLKLNAGGDTISFMPPVTLTNETAYTINMTNVDIKNGLKNQTVALSVSWTTKKGIKLVSANDMASAGTYRAFAVVGDSLVITLSEAVDITKAYSIANFVARKTYAWSNSNKTLTIKNIDTLMAKAYEAVPDYSTNTGTAQYAPITVTCYPVGQTAAVTLNSSTAGDWLVTRPAIKVHTVEGIELLNTNLKENSITHLFYTNSFNLKVSDLTSIQARDSFGIRDSIVLIFSRAVDSAKIAVNPKAFFTLKNSAAGAPAIDFTAIYSTDKKTVTLRLVDSLEASAAGVGYVLTLSSVPAQGLSPSLQGGTVPSYTLNFTTAPIPAKVVSKETVSSLSQDTATTANVLNKRIAFTPGVGNYQSVVSPGVSTDEISFYFNEVSWNAKHNDSVTHYQVRVKGFTGGWFEVRGLIASTSYDPWNPAAANRAHFVQNYDLSTKVDLDGNSIIGMLRRPDLDGAGSKYLNGDDLFNLANVVSIQIRPVISSNANFEYANDTYGAWSSALIFSDNVAPCDSDFVTGANCANAAAGGVTVTDNLLWTWGAAGDSARYIEFSFPEDMDTATKPGVVFKYGNWTPAPTYAPAIAAGNGTTGLSGWSDAQTYRQYVKFPNTGAFDYTNADGGLGTVGAPYIGYAMNISVAAMKDASGNTIQTSGSAGNSVAGTNDIVNGANGQQLGSASVAGWTR